MKHVFWLWTVQCFLIARGTSGEDQEISPVEVRAVLGEEVTFPVRVRDGFEIEDITWDFKGATIATMKPGNNYTVRDKRFAGRLYAADENGSLKIRNLRTEDTGLYTVEIFNKINPTETETKHYELEIFRRVKPEIIFRFNSMNGTCSITLNCTVGDGKGVSYKWIIENFEPSEEPVMSLNLTEEQSNQRVCCAVENLVSHASNCVNLSKHCFQDTVDEGNTISRWKLKPGHFVAIALAGFVPFAAGLGVVVHKVMSAKGKTDQTENTTVYAQIINVSNGTQGGNHYTRTEEKNSKPKLKTIYADVQNARQMEEPVVPNGNYSASEKDVTTTYAKLQKPQSKKYETSESLLGSDLDSGSAYAQVI